MDFECDIIQHAWPRQMPHGECGTTDRRFPPHGVEVSGEIATDHQTHELVVSDAGRVYRRHMLTVLEYGNTIGNREDLIEPMGNEQDRYAPSAQVADERQQMRLLACTQCRSGLVHHQDAWSQGQRPSNLDKLLLRNAQL